MRLSILVSMLFLSLYAFAGAADELLAAAEKAYQAENYQEAIEKYQMLIGEYAQAADLHYNIGNAYFRDGQLGKAVLHLERAAILAPRDQDVQHNLRFVKSQLTDQIEVLPEFFITRWWNNLRSIFGPTGWSIIGLLFLWSGIAGLIIWRRAPERELRKKGFILGIVLIVLSVLPFVLGYDAQRNINNPARAVLMQAEAPFHSAPDPASEQILRLHEGTSMDVLDKIGDWYKVLLSNGEEGWLAAENLEMV